METSSNPSRVDAALPSAYPVVIAAHLCGLSDRAFRRSVLAKGYVVRDQRGQVTRQSIEQFIGQPITADRLVMAHARRRHAVNHQRDYRDRQKQSEVW